MSSSAGHYGNARLHASVGAIPGTREYMQDRFGIKFNAGVKGDIDFLGVFDGHGPNGGVVSLSRT